MGIFGFISKLLGRKEGKGELETVEIDSSQLKTWFDNKVNSMFTELSGDIKGILGKFGDEMLDAEKNLSILEKATLMNDNIPEKIKIVLDGNRESHLQKSRIFLQNIKLPEKISYSLTLEFCDNFQKELAELATQTARSYQILQEFFADESGEVAQNLKNMDSYVRQMRETLSNKSGDVGLVEDIKSAIKLLDHRVSIKKDAIKTMKEEESKSQFLLSEKKKIESLIQELKQNPDFSKLENLNRRKDALKQDIFAQRDELHKLFLPLEKALKKFEHAGHKDSNLITFYLGNELDALKLDKNLKILDVLGELKGMVEGESLDLNDKQKEKALFALQQITASKLNSVLDSVAKKRRDIEDIDRQVRLINIGNDLDDLNYKLKHLDDKMRNAEINKDKIDKAVDKIDIIGLKLDIQKKIRELLGVNLVIFQDYAEENTVEDKSSMAADESA